MKTIANTTDEDHLKEWRDIVDTIRLYSKLDNELEISMRASDLLQAIERRLLQDELPTQLHKVYRHN